MKDEQMQKLLQKNEKNYVSQPKPKAKTAEVFDAEQLKGFIRQLFEFVEEKGPRSLYTNGLRQITIGTEPIQSQNGSNVKFFFIRIWEKPLDAKAKLIYPVFSSIDEADTAAYNTLVTLA